jgi:uncharacterized protein with von Willebrand factor type A (vWA) domain
MTLLDRHVEFVDALREGGLTVSLAEALDAVRALRATPLHDREVLRAVYAATLLKNRTHRRRFDELFDVYFPRVWGAGITRTEEVREAPRLWDIADADRESLRERLSDYLRSGDETGLPELVREAVARLGALPGPGRPSGAGATPAQGWSWSQRAVLERLSAQTLLAGLLGDIRTGDSLSEQVARALIARRLERFEHLVSADVRRRIAEQGKLAAATKDLRGGIEQLDILSATRAQLADLRREIQPLARRLAARMAIAQRHGPRGQLDFRRTIRSSLSTGGALVTTHHRPRRPRLADVVVLCDLSRSVSSFAQFTLLLVYAMREQFARIRAFGFIDDLDEITRFFGPDADVHDAIRRLNEQSRVSWALGRTDYGRALTLFRNRFPGVVGPRTSLLVLGDARSNYGDLALPVLRELAGRARHSYWLNPERRSAWDTGDSAASRYGAVVPMVECRNLAQLSRFVRDLPV